MNELDTQYVLTDAKLGTSSFNSIPYQLNGVRDYSIQVDFTGGGSDLVGTLKLQASNDPTAFTVPGSADWIDVTGSSQAVSSSSSHMWNVIGAHYRTVRYVWTYTSGTGNVTAWLEVKYTGG